MIGGGSKSTLSRFAPLVSRRRAAAAFLGAALINPALSRMLNSTFPRLYGSNWIQQLAPLKESNIRDVIETAVNYYRAGISPKNFSAIARQVQNQLPELPKLAVTKVLSFVSGITQDFPGDWSYLTSGSYSLSDQIKQSVGLAKAGAKSAAYEAQDKLRRGGSAIVSSAIEAQNALPWYMQPRTLLILGGLGVGMFYIAQAQGLLSAFKPRNYTQNPGGRAASRRRRNYRMNPVKQTAKEKKAAALFEKFHAEKPKKRFPIKEIDTKELVKLGSAVELGYNSKKWTGKKQDYLHEFDKGVNLYATADGRALIIHGGKMTVEKEGITH